MSLRPSFPLCLPPVVSGLMTSPLKNVDLGGTRTERTRLVIGLRSETGRLRRTAPDNEQRFFILPSHPRFPDEDDQRSADRWRSRRGSFEM